MLCDRYEQEKENCHSNIFYIYVSFRTCEESFKFVRCCKDAEEAKPAAGSQGLRSFSSWARLRVSDIK